MRLAQSPSDFAKLIKRSLPDFHAAERRAAAILARESIEFAEREDSVMASILKLECQLDGLSDDNARLRKQIAEDTAFEKSLREEFWRSVSAPGVAPQEVSQTEHKVERVRVLIDPFEFFTLERERLEATLETLEERLRVLTREQIVLHSTLPQVMEAAAQAKD
jgi:hypothetical protein